MVDTNLIDVVTVTFFYVLAGVATGVCLGCDYKLSTPETVAVGLFWPLAFLTLAVVGLRRLAYRALPQSKEPALPEAKVVR